MPDIAVIIVNYRTAPLVADSLYTLAAERERLGGKLRVYVVDNNSGDGSASLLAEEIEKRGWDSWVRLMPQAMNLGFAGGNNVALAEIVHTLNNREFIFFLNPDACIRPGAIESSRDILLKRPEIGIIGSLLTNPDGSSRRCAFRFPSPMGEFLRGAKTGIFTRLFQRWEGAPPPRGIHHKTDWVSGAAFMVRSKVFDGVGLMDDGYFLYFEEVDFMLRASEAGWEIWHNPESRVVHLAGQSTKIREGLAQSGPMPEYWYRSWRRYFVKNHGRTGACLAGLCWLLGAILFRIKSALLSRKIDGGAVTITQFFRLSLIPAITRGLG